MLNQVRTVLAAGLLSAGLLTLGACGDDEGGSGGSGGTTTTGGDGGSDGTGGSGGTGGAPIVDSLRVTGTVVDFEAGVPVTGSATASTVGLTPPPTVSVTGADFDIAGVPPFSVFHLLAGAPPDYRNTYSNAIEVTSADVTGVQAAVVSEGYLGTLSAAFGVSPAAGTAIVIVRAVDEAGNPRAGVPGVAFTINGGQPPVPPRFLDDARAPEPGLSQTSASGYAVFYNVPPGLVAFGAAEGSGYTIAGASAPSSANTVTLADVKVTDGGPMLPTNVSFANDVIPIFEMRGCALCHSGNSPGADLGNLTLNGGLNKIHQELTQEISPTYNVTRVDLNAPEQSLLLTMPSLEPEPDAHPNATFTSSADPDYLILLAWIKEGALLN
jgi:hypothetical protein